MADMTVTLKPLDKVKSGKALAYLDPVLMAQYQITPGDLLRIEGHTEPAGTPFVVLARVGFLQRLLRGQGALALDAVLCEYNKLPLEARVHVTKIPSLKGVARLVVHASSPLTGTERTQCVDFLKRNRLPVNRASWFTMVLSPSRQVLLEVRDVIPVHGGMVALDTVIEVRDRLVDEQLKAAEARWQAKVQWEQLTRAVQEREVERTNLERAVHALREDVTAAQAQVKHLQEAMAQAAQDVQRWQEEQHSQPQRWEQALAQKRQELQQLEEECVRLNVEKRQVEGQHQIKQGLDAENAQLRRDLAQWQQKRALLIATRG